MHDRRVGPDGLRMVVENDDANNRLSGRVPSEGRSHRGGRSISERSTADPGGLDVVNSRSGPVDNTRVRESDRGVISSRCGDGSSGYSVRVIRNGIFVDEQRPERLGRVISEVGKVSGGGEATGRGRKLLLIFPLWAIDS